MIKKVLKIGLVLMSVFFVLEQTYAIQLNYVPGNIWKTYVGDTTTANGMTYLLGTAQPQTDIYGNSFISTAYQIQAYDGSLNPMDFWYSYSSSGTKNLWLGSQWGPLQRSMSLPVSGWYVSPTFTSYGSITITAETLQ